MAGIVDLVWIAKEYGIFEYYLPFLIVFTLVFGLLEKANIFGPKARNINVIVALVSALYILVYTPVGTTMAEFFATFFAGTMVILVTGLAFMMIMFLFLPIIGGGLPQWQHAGTYLVLIVASMAFALYLSSGGAGILPGIDIDLSSLGGLGLSTQDWAFIILLLISVESESLNSRFNSSFL